MPPARKGVLYVGFAPCLSTSAVAVLISYTTLPLQRIGLQGSETPFFCFSLIHLCSVEFPSHLSSLPSNAVPFKKAISMCMLYVYTSQPVETLLK